MPPRVKLGTADERIPAGEVSEGLGQCDGPM